MSELVRDGETVPAPPPGFVLSSSRGPFTTHNGPTFHKAEPGEFTEQAFFALKRHCNGYGLVHGGMLTAFMDGLLGGASFKASGKSAVTINLSVNFLHMARAGEWVMGEAKATRATRDVVFVEGRAYVGSRDVVRASAVFKLMHKGVTG